MLVHRLSVARFPALDGEGARLYGGRWNTPGRAVVYTSSSRALAALELLVHVNARRAPANLVLATIDLPDDAVASAATVDPATLPHGWAARVGEPTLKAIGDAWVDDGQALLLGVPSAPIPEEGNWLVNPRHPDAARVRVVATRPFTFDPRLAR